jgi:hypothetical protein
MHPMMIRQAMRSVALLLVVTLVNEAALGRQSSAALDKIVVRKKDGNTTTYDGRLKLSPVGLQVLTGEKLDKATTINFADIVKYEPGEMPGVNRDDMLAQLKLENNKSRKDYETAKGAYANMLKKASSAPEATKRHLEYRIAMMSTRIADESSDEEKWAELANIAAKDWNGFLTGYKSGWEIWPAAKSLARIYAEQNRFDEAAKMWGRMARNPELPPDLKQEAGIEEVDAQFRSKAHSTAATLAETLGKAVTPGPAKDKLAIYQLAAKAADGGLKEATIKPIVAELEKKIAESKDSTVQAVGFGVIGELYLLVNKPREAMWSFLWVETVKNQDREEVLKAMCRLVLSFQAQTDEEMQKKYREKIRRFRTQF